MAKDIKFSWKKYFELDPKLMPWHDQAESFNADRDLSRMAKPAKKKKK